MATHGTSSTPSNVIVPLKLDAFVFNPAVCSGKDIEAKIAPITQPNYTFLRLDNSVVQNDILDHVDLHHTTPAQFNSRLTDLGTRKIRERRVGVYLHWMIPRAYRAGTASTDSVPNPQSHRQKKGFRSPRDDKKVDHSAPDFRSVPPRWLVIRRIDPKTISPAGAPIPEVEAWVIESDRMQGIDELKLEVDLQVDVSPFVYPAKIINIEQQAEVFIGFKVDAKSWTEDTTGKVKRVPQLSLLNSANHLFADYQPHNSNVFSMVDNFSYTDLDGSTKYLTSATASYYVLGWHSSDEEDLFYIPTEPDKPILQERLNACLMKFTDPNTPGVSKWLNSSDSARLLCHGAMYNVEWNATEKPKNVPADVHSKNLNGKMPVAVGTTPLDSLLAFIHAHVDSDTGIIKELEEDLIRIQSLLIAQDDGVESQREAADILYNHNYDRADCGTHFYFTGTGPNGNPTEPSDPEKKMLAELNQVQFALDLHARTVKRLRWDMFSWWWKYVSDSDKNNPVHGDYKKISSDLTARLNKLLLCQTELEEKVESLRKEIPQAKPGVLPSVYQQRDPTLLVGGIESGWPHDYLDKLNVRLDTQIITGTDPDPPPVGWNKFLADIIPKLPPALQKSAGTLAGEFLLLRPDGPIKVPPKNEVFPLYHDQAKHTCGAPWRDRWESTQPWFPLFLEWEAEYTHIPYEFWSLEERTSRQSTAKKLRYGIKDDIILNEKPHDDQRTVSGRVLILPQPSFSLAAKIDQLFSTTPADILEKYLPEEKRRQLQDQLYKLSYLSSPLAGLTDHLLTLVQGSHIKPNKRPPGEKPQPIDAAVRAGKSAGFDKPQLELIDKESDLTPYGTLVQFLDGKFSAFKPATHGQFRFTKLNIIDKFGQAIHAIDPTPLPKGPPALYPCISEFYACQEIPGTNEANTVIKDKPGFCEFVQLPPQINQFSRLNSAFVVHDEVQPGNPYWRPVTEWENPIWGWIVVNYVEYGVQLFLPDGTFYREVRLGGSTGVTSSPAWLPFDPPEKQPTNTAQLDRLIAKLANKTYCQAFVDMINKALGNAPAAPNAYAQFLNTVVGKPLALVNMGWSLELAVDAYANQSTTNKTGPAIGLLPDDTAPHRPVYKFHVKLGDKDRVYDGLVGYFNTLPHPTEGNELDLDNLYTYFDSTLPPSPENPLRIIDKMDYPSFQPFFVKPDDTAPDKIINARNENLSVYGVLIDPFTPVHGYSSFLPIETLTLPSWTWQTAMNKMTAFFHMGPLMVTADIPAYQEKYRLKSNYNLNNPNTVVPGSAVPIPALGIADWNWLQPYVEQTSSESGKEGDGAERIVYMPLGLGKLDNRPKFEKAPYVAIEGYLQLKKPIIRPE
ncbi:hypothetical protein RUND412_000427 [Rhizina undulata]